MKILVTGATGMVGTALIPLLKSEGHKVSRLVRSSRMNGEILWNPETGAIDRDALEGFDAVVHLAGESIASGRWTAARKQRILKSRVDGTRLLCETLAALKQPPRVLVSASAIGFYGNRGQESLTEVSAAGSGFLPDVCLQWESATEAARNKGIRVVCLRIGIVLSTKGGALAAMMPPFRMGAGGRMGSGNQYMSWISLHDLCRAISHSIGSELLSGAVNGVSPAPATNAEFTRALAKALKRPAIFPLPAFAARIVLGEMADELLLASTRVLPQKLMLSGFRFEDENLGGTLRKIVSSNQ